MCYRLVDDETGKIICRSVIRLATEPGTANLQIDPIKPLPPDAIYNTEPGAMLDEMMTMADFNTPFSDVNKKDPFDLIPASTKSKTWQEIKRSKQVEQQEDVQQCYFHSYHPNFPKQQLRYPTRSKTAVNEAETTSETTAGATTKDKKNCPSQRQRGEGTYFQTV